MVIASFILGSVITAVLIGYIAPMRLSAQKEVIMTPSEEAPVMMATSTTATSNKPAVMMKASSTVGL